MTEILLSYWIKSPLANFNDMGIRKKFSYIYEYGKIYLIDVDDRSETFGHNQFIRNWRAGHFAALDLPQNFKLEKLLLTWTYFSDFWSYKQDF